MSSHKSALGLGVHANAAVSARSQAFPGFTARPVYQQIG
jgi:hypothetical protein